MISEYALEPEMVAAWGNRLNQRFFIREFELGQGRLVSRYPKKWAKKVWDSFDSESEMDKKRLEELLIRLKETMVKRKDMVWDKDKTWLDNAWQEHDRYPFQAILAGNNPEDRLEVLCEDSLVPGPCPGWDNPHGEIVARQATAMTEAVKGMLTCCRWVRFIDPYIAHCNQRHKDSLQAFFSVLFRERAVGPPDTIEIHTSGDGASNDHVKGFYGRITPTGIQVTLYRWKERPGGQRLHNRYILTDIGGVSFLHGLDTGQAGETDDIHRLDLAQYTLRCQQYDPAALAFDRAAEPLIITGILGG